MPPINDNGFDDVTTRISAIIGANATKIIDAMLNSKRPKGHITGSNRIKDDFNREQ